MPDTSSYSDFLDGLGKTLDVAGQAATDYYQIIASRQSSTLPAPQTPNNDSLINHGSGPVAVQPIPPPTATAAAQMSNFGISPVVGIALVLGLIGVLIVIRK